MFFYLSKILAFLISPFTWLFVLLVVLLKKIWYTPYRRLGLVIVVGLYVCSNSFLTDELVRAWEYEDDDIYLKNTKYDLALVLGGMGRIDERQNRFDFGPGADRLMQTLELYKKGRVKKIMISGGSGSISLPHLKEAVYLHRFLVHIGIPDSVLIMESESKNTHENAVFSKKVLDSLQFKGSILLVTSSFHMRRALGCYNKAGFTRLTPFVTNKFTGDRKFEIDYCFIPNDEALNRLCLIVHEITGYIVYSLRGYI
ncbi:MAG: YdcF family protein [Bacteroidetes bacterium]|nr:YdcF family protein [Bacteroidota bacterium]